MLAISESVAYFKNNEGTEVVKTSMPSKPECRAITTQILTRIISHLKIRICPLPSYSGAHARVRKATARMQRIPGLVAMLWNTGQRGGEASAPERKTGGCQWDPYRGSWLKAYLARLGALPTRRS